MIGKVRGLVLLGLVVAIPASGQPTPKTVIPDEPTCKRCRIVSEVVATIGGADGPGSLVGPPTYVLADARERFWALSPDALPVVYDRQGRFIKQIGTRGQGPGEFIRAMTAMVVPGDSVAIFDGPAQRTTVVAPDLSISRLIRTPVQVMGGLAAGWPSQVILSGSLTTAAGVGWPLHIVSLVGSEAVASAHFGPGDGTVLPGRSGVNVQQLAAARTGGLWSADVTQYRLTLWSLQGQQLKTLERRPPWFNSSPGGSLGTPSSPPPSGIVAIYEDPMSGHVWVFVRVAASTWRDAWPSQTSAGVREVSMRDIALEKLFATRIEVLNPATGRVVARGALDAFVLNTLSNQRVATYVVDSAGLPRVEIVSLRISPL